MGFPQDLIEQAEHLALRERTRPKQASLRRPVSTAYYALFHLLVEEACRNWRDASQRLTLARAFDHGPMKSSCEQFRAKLIQMSTAGHTAAPEQHLLTVVEAFVESQEARHKADYDSSDRWTRADALTRIDAVKEAFRSWTAVRAEKLAQEFLLSLLVKRRGR